MLAIRAYTTDKKKMTREYPNSLFLLLRNIEASFRVVFRSTASLDEEIAGDCWSILKQLHVELQNMRYINNEKY